MIIEAVTQLRQVNTVLEDMNLPQKEGSSYSCPVMIETSHIVTSRPYLDADGMPDFDYCNVSLVNGELMLIKFNYYNLRTILKPEIDEPKISK